MPIAVSHGAASVNEVVNISATKLDDTGTWGLELTTGAARANDLDNGVKNVSFDTN
jgi:hypothetical protein